MSVPTFCLLTDFGRENNYVGVMKGVLLSAVPGAQIIDLTHNVPAQDIRTGAFELLSGYRFQPKGSMFICVVDPGVGSDRDILYAEFGSWRFIAPDNGLLSWVFGDVPTIKLLKIDPSKVGKEISATFHGRDIMAPVAGRILAGQEPEQFGATVSTFVRLPFPAVQKKGSMWQGEVLCADSFGNLITNIRAAEARPLADSSKMSIALENYSGSVRGFSKTYADGEKGRPIALEGSSGFIEIAVNQGNASAVTGLKAGGRVEIHFRA